MRKVIAGQGHTTQLVLESGAGLGDLLGITVDRSYSRNAGLCARPGEDPNLMFPAAKHDPQVRAALALCSGCPVRSACWLEGQDEPHGIWGGETEWERRDRRAAQKDAQVSPVIAAVA